MNNHIIKSQYKLINAYTLTDLQNKINKFIELYPDAVVGQVTTNQINQKGMALCDRINPNTDYATEYIVSIQHNVDITEKNIEEASNQWLRNKILNDVKYIHDDPYTLTSKEEIIKKLVSQLKESQEYKDFIAKKEIEFSKEE